MEELEIKPLNVTDKAQYLELFSKLLSVAFPEYSEKTKKYLNETKEKTFIDEVENKVFFYFGAWKENTLVGIIEGGFLGGGVAYCSWLLVHPDFQHQGIGKKLLDSIEEMLIKKGIHSLHLYASKWNNPYYEKMGFEQVGLYRNAWYGSSDYLYAKTIQEPKEKNFLQ